MQFTLPKEQTEAKKWLAQVNEFSKLNEIVVDSTDVSEFLEFINNQNSDLTSVKGIGTILAEQIVHNSSNSTFVAIQMRLFFSNTIIQFIHSSIFIKVDSLATLFIRIIRCFNSFVT